MRRAIKAPLIVLILLAFSFAFLAEPFTVYAASPVWSGGSASFPGTGTEADPYVISTGEQLKYLSDQVNGGNTYAGKYIKLADDIVLNNPSGTRQFTAIGKSNRPFLGHFDGDGKSITGLFISAQDVNYQGLFGYAGAGSIIENIVLSGKVTGAEKTGAVVGYSDGTVKSCIISATVEPNWKNYHGGIVGEAGVNSIISDSVFTGVVNGSSYVGGVAGRTKGKIIGCEVTATIAAQAEAGGIAAFAEGLGSRIEDCTFKGSVSTHGVNAGGIVGKLQGTVSGCSSDAEVRAGSGYAGGIAGRSETGSIIENVRVSGKVSGNTGWIGGIVGWTDGTVRICINTARVESTSLYNGGIAGWAGPNAVIRNCYNQGFVVGLSGQYHGGIAGYVSAGTTVQNNLNVGQVSGGASNHTGSIFGNNPSQADTSDNYYNDDYPGAPAGYGGAGNNDDPAGDHGPESGAVPVGDMTWEELQEELNDDNEDGPVWNQDLDDDGIPKPGTETEPTVTASAKIIPGKYYTKLGLGEGAEVAITADSVFTVFYSLKYTSGYNPKDQVLIMKDGSQVEDFPSGTSITMLYEGSYYYINLGEDRSGVSLASFFAMGTFAEHFNPDSVGGSAEKEYLFICDFTKVAGIDQIPSGNYNFELVPSGGSYPNTAPKVTVTAPNSYTLDVNDGIDAVEILFTPTLSSGYDHKTYGKEMVYEIKFSGVNLPTGTKVNGNPVSSSVPYVFISATDDPVTFDMSECGSPLLSDEYSVDVTVYAATSLQGARSGYVLANGEGYISLLSPTVYAIKTDAASSRLLERSSPSLYLKCGVDTLPQESVSVKYTLQKKIGVNYSNVAGYVDRDVNVTGAGVTLNMPQDVSRGTYRFLVKLFHNGAERARSVENVIVK